jgi:hypothetical protein
MKTILLDENLPLQLKQLFPPTDYRVFTVRELGWQNKKNGELLYSYEIDLPKNERLNVSKLNSYEIRNPQTEIL